jgi:hypothetical protein
MIWYYLSKGKLQIPDPQKYTLVCTYLTLTELAFTPNNFRKLDEVQDAIKKIFNLKPELILLYPFDHARTLVDENYKPEFKVEEDLVFAFLRVLLNHPNDGLLNNKFKGQLLDVVARRKENSADWSDFLNELNQPTKEISWVFKKHHSQEQEKSRLQGWFILQLNQLSDNTYSTDVVDWRNFEFYENVYRRYHRNLLVSKMKADINDNNDLENMIYVQPADLYWTLEKRWLTIAKESKVEKYLYLE